MSPTESMRGRHCIGTRHYPPYAPVVGIRVDPIRGVVNIYERAPVIEVPYVRWGSGYAHAACAGRA